MGTPIDVELPGAFFDALFEDAAASIAGATPTLINRDPEPDETRVPKTTHIQLEIATVAAGGQISVLDTEIWVEGVLAFRHGAFTPEYGGAEAAYYNPQSDVLRLVLAPVTPLPSQSVVHVRVVSKAVADTGVLDETYSFTIADTTAPQPSQAEAVDLARVRVRFTEPMYLGSPEEEASALCPSNWSIARFGDYLRPLVAASVIAVLPTTDLQAVDLVTDIPLTPGGTYQAAVLNATDVNGNPVEAPFNSAGFAGWEPPAPAGRSFDLYKKFPDFNVREDDTQDLLRTVGCIQEVANLLLYDIDKFLDIIDPDTAPELFVDAMLADLGNPFSFELSLIDKRRLLNVLVDIYRLKGTEVGVRNVTRFFLGVEVEVLAYNTRAGWTLGETALGDGNYLGSSLRANLYSFDVQVSEQLDATTRSRLMTIVEYMKPAHTHFVRLIEPPPVGFVDHMLLGESLLGETWYLH